MEQESDDQRADSAEEEPLVLPWSANRVSEQEGYTFKSLDRSRKFKFNRGITIGSDSSPKNTTK